MLLLGLGIAAGVVLLVGTILGIVFGALGAMRKRLARELAALELMLASDNPFGASGHMSLRLSVADAASWVRALRDAGALAG